LAPCFAAISIWYSHHDAPQSWIYEVPVNGDRTSATEVTSRRSSEETSVRGKTEMAILDHLAPASSICDAFFGNTRNLRNGRAKARVNLLGNVHLRAARIDVDADPGSGLGPASIICRLSSVQNPLAALHDGGDFIRPQARPTAGMHPRRRREGQGWYIAAMA